MDKTGYNATCLKEYQTVVIGRQMENNYRQFVFNCAGFGDVAEITLVHQRSQDVAPYIVTSVTGNTLTWTVTDTDTAFSGEGQAELRITFADGLAKSVIFRTLVIKSITADTVIPEALQSWYDAMIAYINDHSVTDEQLAQAIADYLEEHPIEALVTSVNGQQGAVVLTAADVGAIADTVTIPTRTSQLQNDSGFISSVPVTSVNGKTGAVNLTASDVNALPASTEIPSKTSDLVNDSGFLSSAVTSFNGQTGAVTYTAPVSSVDGKTGTVTILPTGGTTGQVLAKKTGTNYDVEWQAVSGGGAVDSVNGKTGTVVLDADDVGALPDDTAYVESFNGQTGAVTYTAPVTSVNAQTGAITVNEVFWCTYGTTTSAEIEAALTAGKIPMVMYQDYAYTLRYRNSTTNHRFVCNYGGKEKSVACQSGTWIPNGDLTFLTTSYTPPVTSVNGSTGAVVIANATTSAAGLMSATDKSHLDSVYADYSSALTALGVI